MALGGCYAVLKFLLVLVNLVIWLAGIAVIAVAVWLLSDDSVYVNVAQDTSSTYAGIYILFAAGSLMFIIGFIGCCGTLKESPCLLVTFFCVLLIILVAEIAACVWIYSNGSELEQLMYDHLKEAVQKDYGFVQTKTKAFDAIQANLKCCGATGPGDWAGARYNQADKKGDGGKVLNMAISSTQSYKLPQSCCKARDPLVCGSDANVGVSAQISENIYKDGCFEEIKQVLIEHMAIGWAVVIAVLLIEVFGLLVSLLLCCAIRSYEDYKS